MVKELLMALLTTIVQIFASILLSLGAIIIGLRLLDRLTAGIDEWQEIRKGNTAVGIFYATAVLCLMILMLPRIEDIVSLLNFGMPLLATVYYLALAAINFILALCLSVVLLFVSVNILDKLTYDIDEIGALKRGNIAVALLMSMMLLAVTLAARAPMDSTFLIVRAVEAILTG